MMKQLTAAAVLLGYACLCVPHAAAQTADEGAIATAFLDDLRQSNNVPGMSAAIVMHGELIWSGASGLSSVELAVPADEHTVYRLGSVSKVLTATLAVRMAQAGLVDLDAQIGSYRPSLPRDKHAITLRQLLGHLGGVRHYSFADYNPSAPGGSIDLRVYRDRDDQLAIFIDDPLKAEPGQEYLYTTFGYTLIGAVLESAGNKPFWELMQEHVLGPLGNDGIRRDVLWEVIPGRTEHYDPGSRYRRIYPEGAAIVKANPVNPAYKIEGGGMLADAPSLAMFGHAMAAPGFLDKDSFTETFTVQSDGDGEATGVGLGWRIGEDQDGRLIYHHAGSMQGTRAMVLVYPEEGLAVALLSNLGGTPDDILTPASELASIFLGEQ